MQHLAFQWELLGSLHGIEDVHVSVYIGNCTAKDDAVCAMWKKWQRPFKLLFELTCDSVLAGGGSAMSKARIPLALHSDSDEEGASVVKFGLSAVICQHPNPKKYMICIYTPEI